MDIPTQPMLDHIIVVYRNKQYTIYTDGVVYDNSTAEDIPELVFKIRDLYVSQYN